MYIRDENCSDGDFSLRSDCKEWLRVFSEYVESKLRPLFEIRIRTYYNMGNQYLTVDAHSLTSKDSIPITILINKPLLELDDPCCDEQVIALPGLKDALYFAGALLNRAKGKDIPSVTSIHNDGLWVSLGNDGC